MKTGEVHCEERYFGKGKDDPEREKVQKKKKSLPRPGTEKGENRIRQQGEKSF